VGVLKEKLRFIYLPFLIIGVSVIGLYTLLNWLLFIKLDLFSLREIIKNFGLPFSLSWISILIWLRPRINLMKFNRKNTSTHYQCVAFCMIGLSTFIAQEYLTTASGKLTELESINSIDKQEKTKFYTVKNYFVSKRNFGLHTSAEMTGRYNQNLLLSLFITLPIYESIADSTKQVCPAWIGIKYAENISNQLSDEEKQRKFEEFLDKNQKDFDSKDVQQFVYFDRIGSSDDLDGYKEALKTSPKFNSINDIVLITVNKPFEARNGNTFAWIFISYGIGAFIWFVMLLFPKFDEERLTGLLNRNPIEEELKELLSFFIPTKDYFVTPILLSLNIFIYLMMFLSGYGFIAIRASDLLKWGANYGPSITEGEYWRLLSSTFLHGGIGHLMANMAGLLFIGMCLEPFLGKVKFAFIYLLTGVLASLSSIYWYEAIVSVGASGAIFGLHGLFLAFLLRNALPEFLPELKSFFLMMILIFVGFNLIMGFTDGIDNAAHIGGLISGFILGLLIAKPDKTIVMQTSK
jgi:rhomboid protease GluP